MSGMTTRAVGSGERRRAARRATNWRAMIIAGTRDLDGEILEVSESGALCRVAGLGIGNVVHLIMVVRDDVRLEAIARVVHVEDGVVGLAFLRIGPADALIVRQYVSGRSII